MKLISRVMFVMGFLSLSYGLLGLFVQANFSFLVANLPYNMISILTIF